MKRLIIVTLFCAGLMPEAHAQQKQTIFYEDGQKAIEGSWRYTGMLPYSNSTDGYYGGMLEQWLQTEQLAFSYSAEISKLYYVSAYILFNGPYQSWYTNGKPHMTCTFKNNIIDGPVVVYHRDGTKAIDLGFTNGCITGRYTDFYTNGQKRLTGTYQPFSRKEQDSLVWYFKRKITAPFKYSDNLKNTVASEVNSKFRNYTRHILLYSKKTGPFEYYNETGDLAAVMNYKNNKAEGDWILYKAGQVNLRATFKADTLVTATDANGKDWLELLKQQQQEQLDAKMEGKSWGSPDPNAIDPGIGVDAPPAEVAQPGPQVFRFVEQMPEFPGGTSAMSSFITNNLKYPEKAMKNGIQGRVIIQFVVGADGSIRDVEAVRKLDPDCDKEAIRVVKKMPKWKPGKQNGRAVAVYFNLPVSFKQEQK
jgi:TonB family protein